MNRIVKSETEGPYVRHQLEDGSFVVIRRDAMLVKDKHDWLAFVLFMVFIGLCLTFIFLAVL